MVESGSGIFEFPLPDDVRKMIEEILKERKAKEELMRIGILGLIKSKGGEVRLAKKVGSMEPQIRKYEEGDLSVLVKLVNENYMDYPDFFYEFIPYTERTLRPEVEGKPLVYVAENRAIEGFIACSTDWSIRVNLLCVKPGPSRTGIEDMLISEVEEQAKGRELSVWLSSDSRIADFEKRGYESYGGFCHLVRSLYNIPPVPPLGKGVTLRAMGEREEKTVTEIFYDPKHVGTDIFKPGFTKEWTEDWNQIAEWDGRIVAIVCSRPRHAFNEYFNAKRAEIWGPVAVLECRGHPDYRGTVAKPLMCRALNSLRERGMEMASIWDVEWPPEHINFAMSLGFRVKNHWKFLCKYV
ncbi:MAG: hypothetical protein ACETV1_00130 [Candidatus Bathyarchaeia archaeon]